MKHVNSTLERDRKVIESVIRRFGPVSQVKITELTDIRPTTISLLVRELIEEGWVREVGRSNNPMGRKQVLLLPNHQFRLIGSVAFDDETVQAGVLDMQPAIRHQIAEPTRMKSGKKELIRQLVACTRRVIKEAEVNEPLAGISIADPGLVDSRTGVSVVSSTIPFWRSVPLRAIFEEEFGVPVFLQSGTRTKTLAERILGAGRMSQSMLYIDYGAGIGAGIIIDGKLLLGSGGAAGEFGHTHVIEGGPVCTCGSYGCLEAIAGIRALETKVKKALNEGVISSTLDLVGGDLSKLTGWTVLQGVNLGDKLSSHIVNEATGYLGAGISNLVNLFNPEVVVLDQRMALAGPELLNSLLQIIRRQSVTSNCNKLEFRHGMFGPEASLLGAALVVIEDHFEIPSLKPPRFLIEPGLIESSLIESSPIGA